LRFGIVHHSLGHDVPLDKAMETAYRYGSLVFATAANTDNKQLLADLSAQYNLELVTSWGDRFIEHGNHQPVDEFRQLCTDVYAPLGIKIVATCSSHHRWRKDPPLEEQLARLAGALRRLCRVASDYGVTLAIENHADYRAQDILDLLERVDSPWLRVQLDTGNPFAVAEEPVEAVEQLAPYAVSTHIKDMTIRPLTDGEWVKVLGCPIGDGDVDIETIAHILAAEAPSDLPFVLEVETPPGSAKQSDCDRSVAFVRNHLADLVSFHT